MQTLARDSEHPREFGFFAPLAQLKRGGACKFVPKGRVGAGPKSGAGCGLPVGAGQLLTGVTGEGFGSRDERCGQFEELVEVGGRGVVHGGRFVGRWTFVIY